jgi:hypothetical protein
MFCIKHTDFKSDKVTLGDNKQYENYILTHILYNYGDSITKQFNFLTDYINITGYRSNRKSNSNKFKFYSDNPELLKIFNSVKEVIKNNTQLETIIESEENEEDVEDVNEKEENKSIDNRNNYVRLYFINGISQVTLFPSKKSCMDEYQLSKVENCNEVLRYFPSINNNNNLICGKFTINVSLINNIPRFTIINSVIKYKSTYPTNTVLNYNIHKNKIQIEL